MLLCVVCRIRDNYIDNLTVLLNECVLRVYKATVRLDTEGIVALTNLLVELRLDSYAILLNKLLASLVVALALDALYLLEHLTEECAECVEIVYNDILLAILLNPLDNIILLALLIAPLCNHLAVTHV